MNRRSFGKLVAVFVGSAAGGTAASVLSGCASAPRREGEPGGSPDILERPSNSDLKHMREGTYPEGLRTPEARLDYQSRMLLQQHRYVTRDTGVAVPHKIVLTVPGQLAEVNNNTMLRLGFARTDLLDSAAIEEEFITTAFTTDKGAIYINPRSRLAREKIGLGKGPTEVADFNRLVTYLVLNAYGSSNAGYGELPNPIDFSSIAKDKTSPVFTHAYGLALFGSVGDSRTSTTMFHLGLQTYLADKVASDFNFKPPVGYAEEALVANLIGVVSGSIDLTTQDWIGFVNANDPNVLIDEISRRIPENDQGTPRQNAERIYLNIANLPNAMLHGYSPGEVEERIREFLPQPYIAPGDNRGQIHTVRQI